MKPYGSSMTNFSSMADVMNQQRAMVQPNQQQQQMQQYYQIPSGYHDYPINSKNNSSNNLLSLKNYTDGASKPFQKADSFQEPHGIIQGSSTRVTGNLMTPGSNSHIDTLFYPDLQKKQSVTNLFANPGGASSINLNYSFSSQNHAGTTSTPQLPRISSNEVDSIFNMNFNNHQGQHFNQMRTSGFQSPRAEEENFGSMFPKLAK